MKTNALPLPLPSLATAVAARSIAARRRVGEVGSGPERRPIDLLESQPQAVLEAARDDRFIASG